MAGEDCRRAAVGAWCGKGDGDLRSARALLAIDPPETEASAFHSQQAAEKYLKGLLVGLGLDPPRTHDLGVLLDLARSQAAGLDRLRACALFLVPFAVQVRYPFSGEPPTAREAALALQRAEEICEVARARLGL